MKKRMISFMLTVVMLIGMLPLTASAAEIVAGGTCGENLTWTLDDAGMLIISGTGEMTEFDPHSNVAPWRNERISLTTVVIEEGVTSIGACAFPMYGNLKTIFIPKSLTGVGTYAFYASKLADIYYAGSEAEWNAVENHPANARVHYACSDADNHWETKRVKATCTTAGYSSEVCPCGHERNVQQTQEALGHDPGKWVITKEANAFAYGERVCVCRRKDCDYIKAEMIPADTMDYPNDPPASVDTVDEKVDWIAEKCRETGLTDPWEIALWLHDWLIYNANYDYTFANHGADGVLLKGNGVCDSYTKAYGLLLNEFGIENRRVVGNVTTSDIGHAWNLVKIDGAWCHIDCTWDDPGLGGGMEHHGYFGMTNEMLAMDHIWSESSYPVSTSKINFYPIRAGYPLFETREEMMSLISEEVAKRKDQFYLYYLGDDPEFPFWEIIAEWERTYGWKYGTEGIVSQDWTGNHIYLRVLSYGEPREKPEDFDATHTHYYTERTRTATCFAPGMTANVCICGDTQVLSQTPALEHQWQDANCMAPKTCEICGATVGGTGGHIYTNASDTSCNICGAVLQVELDRSTVNMFRMYNPNTGEHFYTGSTVERDNLIEAGWRYEGVGFTFPANTGAPVYRLFQPSTGEHLYTMDKAEKEKLEAEGWNYEGIAFNSAYDTEAVQHRLHNPNATVGAYHFTFSEEEKQNLIDAGWEYQGIGWYSCWK